MFKNICFHSSIMTSGFGPFLTIKTALKGSINDILNSKTNTLMMTAQTCIHNQPRPLFTSRYTLCYGHHLQSWTGTFFVPPLNMIAFNDNNIHSTTQA